MSDSDALGIEKALAASDGTFIDKYRLMKSRLLNHEYEHWAAGWPEGNNHGRGHILRVLSYLDLLVGPEPLKYLSRYELFLTMMSVLYHDIGILQQRKDHADLSKLMLDEDRNNAYIVNAIDKRIIGAAVVSHSSSKDIATECAKFSPVEIIAGHKARPHVIAALVRLADELDEDYRRADSILEGRLNLPAESAFFWRFCQRITGVQPDFHRKSIDFHLALEPEDTTAYGVVPGQKMRHFVAFAAEKLAKINRERVNVNRFLPAELRFSTLHVDVKPLRDLATWTTPRAFVFNDSTTAAMFVNSFPELLLKPANRSLAQVLTLMQDGDLGKARQELERLDSVSADLPASVRLYVLYERACILSLEAEVMAKGSAGREGALDEAAEQIVEWYKLGKDGAFDETGRIPSAEAHRLASDSDLQLVLAERRPRLPDEIPSKRRGGVPRALSKAGGRSSSGCVAAGSLIDSPLGPRLVEEVREGDEVLSLSNKDDLLRRTCSRITAVASSRSPCLVVLNGRWYLTPSQPVLTSRGWVNAGALAAGEIVTTGDGLSQALLDVRVAQGYAQVFDISVDDASHNYFVDGLVCHNKGRGRPFIEQKREDDF
jgi:hypothetical protein